MPERVDPVEGVVFSQIQLVDYIDLPNNALVDFLPGDTTRIHHAVDAVLVQPDGLELLIAAELGPDALPWATGQLFIEDIDLVGDWRAGFSSKLEFLKGLAAFIGPLSPKPVPRNKLNWLVSNGVAVYLELVELTASVDNWTEDELNDARLKVLAELAGPNNNQAWLNWNKRSIGYTDRIVKRLNEILRQPAA